MTDRLISARESLDDRHVHVYQFEQWFYRVRNAKRVRVEYPEMWYATDFFYETEEEAYHAMTDWYENGIEPTESVFQPVADAVFMLKKPLQDALDTYTILLPKFREYEKKIHDVNDTITTLREKLQHAQDALWTFTHKDDEK